MTVCIDPAGVRGTPQQSDHSAPTSNNRRSSRGEKAAGGCYQLRNAWLVLGGIKCYTIRLVLQCLLRHGQLGHLCDLSKGAHMLAHVYTHAGTHIHTSLMERGKRVVSSVGPACNVVHTCKRSFPEMPKPSINSKTSCPAYAIMPDSSGP
jgi:hypothetical protein